MNDFHKFQKFRQCSNLFSQIRLKKPRLSDTCYSFLEFVTKSGQKFIKNSQKNCKIRFRKWKKIGNSLSIREKMLTIFGWNFEIEQVLLLFFKTYFFSFIYPLKKLLINLLKSIKKLARYSKQVSKQATK